MIYCPKCGTANRDGSKFCNECGGRLPEAPPELAAPAPEAPDLARLLAEEELPEPELAAPEAPEAPIEAPWPGEEETIAAAEREAVAEELAEEAGPKGPTAEPAEPPTGEEQPAEEPAVEEPVPIEPEEMRLSAPGLKEQLAKPTPPGHRAPVLADIKNPIPIAPIISQPHPASPTSQPIPSKAELQEAKLLEQLLVIEPRLRGEAGVTPARRWVPTLRRVLIALLLAAAVLAPLLAPSGWSSFLLGPAPEVARVFEAVETLPAGTPVLVAFDYTPATAGELDPQARALIRHLLSRGLPLVTVSLVPEGPALAQRVLDRELTAYPKARYGGAYVHLGYLAGGEAALRALAEGLPGPVAEDYLIGLPLRELPATAGVSGLDDLGLIVVLAGDSEHVRWWVEQVGTRTRTPLAAGVSAASEPQLRPYLDSGQLVGLISGVRGAAQYESQLAQGEALIQTGEVWAGRLDALSLSLLALILVILVGNLVPWISQSR
jgi:hypothetical protein